MEVMEKDVHMRFLKIWFVFIHGIKPTERLIGEMAVMGVILLIWLGDLNMPWGMRVITCIMGMSVMAYLKLEVEVEIRGIRGELGLQNFT